MAAASGTMQATARTTAAPIAAAGAGPPAGASISSSGRKTNM